MNKAILLLAAVSFLLISVWNFLEGDKFGGMGSLVIAEMNLCAFFIVLAIEKRQ